MSEKKILDDEQLFKVSGGELSSKVAKDVLRIISEGSNNMNKEYFLAKKAALNDYLIANPDISEEEREVINSLLQQIEDNLSSYAILEND